MAIALDAGAEDMKNAGGEYRDHLRASVLFQSPGRAQQKKVITDVAELTQLPLTPIDVDVETARKILRLIENLDDHDDTQNVYSNLNMTDHLAAELSKGE